MASDGEPREYRRREVIPGQPFPWEQGEHMAIIGRTGSGKSTLAARLLDQWPWRIVVKTKADDVEYPDAREVTMAGEIESDRRTLAFILQPAYDDRAAEIWKVLEYIYNVGSWATYVDEMLTVDKHLGLTAQIDKLETQGRSLGITVIAGAQRPTQISRFVLGEATHVLSFGQERRDAKIMGEIAGDRFQAAVERLRRYEFAWYHSHSRRVRVLTLDTRSGDLVEVDR